MLTGQLPKAEFLQAWNEDETLYSWAATRHRLMGAVSAKASGQIMFSRPHACWQHEIPCGLSQFVQWTLGRLGGIEELATDRTILGEWKPSLPAAVWEQLVHDLANDSPEKIRSTYGIAASKIGFRRPLRSCPRCAEGARSERYIAPWRMQHQYLGSAVCLEHQIPLCEYTHGTRQWVLPDDVPAGQLRWISLSDANLDAALLLAAIGVEWIKKDTISLERLRQATIAALIGLGVVHSKARLDVSKLTSWFSGSSVAHVVQRLYPDRMDLSSATWLREILRARKIGHPLLWQIAWAAILEGVPFSKAVSQVRAAFAGVAGEIGSQLELWDGDLHTYEIPLDAQQVFLNSATLTDAAVRIGVPVTTARRWLMKNPEFRASWLNHNKQAKHREVEAAIQIFLKQNPESTRTTLLQKCKAEVAWLAANSPHSLRALLDMMPSSRVRQLNLPLVQVV